MGNKMPHKGMSVGPLCSFIGHTVGFQQGKWPGYTWETTTEGKERHWSEIGGTKIGKAFAETQRIIECFVKASLQAVASQLWSIHWTLCWSSDPPVKEVWMRKEQVNDKCNRSETQVTLECPRWNASSRWVSRECPPRAGCRPKSHLYRKWWINQNLRNFIFSAINCIVQPIKMYKSKAYFAIRKSKKLMLTPQKRDDSFPVIFNLFLAEQLSKTICSSLWGKCALIQIHICEALYCVIPSKNML